MPRYKRKKSDGRLLYTPVKERLTVLIDGLIAGTLSEHSGNYLSFEYDSGYADTDLSVAIPVDAKTVYPDSEVYPFFDGLLPDNILIRNAMAREASIPRAKTFDLLKFYGKDLPGAIQVCVESEIDAVIGRRVDTPRG